MLLLLLQIALAASPLDTVVVCPAVFREELRPWVEYRTHQGHGIEIVASDGGLEAICSRIRSLAGRGGVKHVVLVGDSEPQTAGDPIAAARNVPAQLARAKVNIHFGSEPEIASDNAYADF